jgi:hypothetical protein
MIANRVKINHSVTPARIRFPPSFNACGLFVDHHLDEGRADKAVARGRTWTLTFGELHTAACKVGDMLKSLGVKPGDHVMLFAKDTPAFYIGFLGAIRIGAVVIPTNTFLRSADYAYMLADSKSKVVLVVDGMIEEVEPALSRPSVVVEHRIAIDSNRDGWLKLDKLLASTSADCPIVETTPNSPCFWLDVEDMLAERGIDMSYETVRRWALKFGTIIACKLRRGRPRPDGRWYLDEVFISINGRQLYVWRAVDSEGEVLDILVQADAETSKEAGYHTSHNRDRQASILRFCAARTWCCVASQHGSPEE